MSYLNINNTEIIIYSSIPSRWIVGDYIIENYNSMGEQRFYEDGFRQLVYPEYDTQLQKLGEIYFDTPNDVFTYEVLNKTQQEIEAEVIQNHEANKQTAINTYLEKQIQIQIEIEELDGTEALENQSIYPFWSGDGEAVVTGNKRNHFSTDGLEIWLWRCRQNHTTQPDWIPKDSPSLWERVEQDGEVLPYDANRVYQIGERCSWQGKVYKCIMANTTWSPTDYPPAWKYKYDL